MLWDGSAYLKGRDLAARISNKRLQASKTGVQLNSIADCQVSFELACARTLTNIAPLTDTYPNDAPYWVVPLALVLARELGMDETEITDIAANTWQG